MANNTEQELLDNNFYSWLEDHGVELSGQHSNGDWKATVDLNELKPAIMNLIEAEATRREKALLHEFEECIPLVGIANREAIGIYKLDPSQQDFDRGQNYARDILSFAIGKKRRSLEGGDDV